MPARTQKKALDAGHHSDPGGNSWKILFFRRMLPEIVSMKKMWILRGFKKIQLYIQLWLLAYWGDIPV